MVLFPGSVRNHYHPELSRAVSPPLGTQHNDLLTSTTACRPITQLDAGWLQKDCRLKDGANYCKEAVGIGAVHVQVAITTVCSHFITVELTGGGSKDRLLKLLAEGKDWIKIR